MRFLQNAGGEIVGIIYEPHDTLEQVAAYSHLTISELCAELKKIINGERGE